MPLIDYFKKCIFQDLQTRKAHGLHKLEQVAIKELVLGSPVETNPVRWMTQCRLYCQVCNEFSANSKVALIRHLEKSHAMPDWKYLSKFRRWYKEEDKKHYKCGVCARKVLLSEDSVKGQLVLKINEIRTKKGVDFIEQLLDYYKAQHK